VERGSARYNTLANLDRADISSILGLAVLRPG
jgi:hypothetical protein